MTQDLLVLGQWNRYKFDDFVRFWLMKILIYLLRLYAFGRISAISFFHSLTQLCSNNNIQNHMDMWILQAIIFWNDSDFTTVKVEVIQWTSPIMQKDRNNAFPSFSNIKFYQTEYHSPGTWMGFVVNCISIIYIAFPIQLSGEWFVIKLTQEMQKGADI